jgi:DNA-binding IclR family transcriptional regulator
MRTKAVKSAPVGVIEKVLRILELLDRSAGGLQLREIAEQAGINRSTAHRFLSHLEAQGYLFRDSVGAYMLGLKLTRLGSGSTFQATLCKICRPTLETLHKSTGETINLAVLDGLDILYLDVLETRHTFRLVSHIGEHLPAHCTALGKAILANLDEEQRNEILSSARLKPSTPKTVTNVARLKKQLAEIRDKGYAIEDEEAVTGVRCLGAAIVGAEGEIVGGISISGPVVRITKDLLPGFSKEIRAAAREISWRLNHRVAKAQAGKSERG